jgi:hypothetical protein
MDRDRRGSWVAVGVLGLLAALAVAAAAFPVGGFVRSGDPMIGRVHATATLLADGRVLVAGGGTASAELYDPATGTFSPTGSMGTVRSLASATRLPDGRVLVAGGQGTATTTASADLYSSTTGTFSPTGSLLAPRFFHVAAPLPGGRVLVAGGQSATGLDLATAEVWSPATGLFAATGSLPTGRRATSATPLLDGRVLVVGGANTSGGPAPTLADAYLYDAVTGAFTPTGTPAIARHGHVAVRLRDGRVLVAGGFEFITNSHPTGAEIYDPNTGAFTPTGHLTVGRLHADAALLPDGKVLVVGGLFVGTSTFLDTAEVYDPATGTFQLVPTALTDPRYFGTATALADGRVLSVTGLSGCCVPRTADLYVHPNTAPVADPQAVTTAEDTPVAITLTGSDAEGSPLAFAIAMPPAHGTLSGMPPGLLYTPAANYHGPDSFTFTASDGVATSAAATVSITVTAVSDAPVARDDAYTTAEDATLIAAPGILANDTDADGGPLTAVLVSGPAHGTLVLGPGGSFTYTPAPDYHGPDGFTYRASDGEATSAPATVSITVTPVNDAPVAAAQGVTTAEDTPVGITLGGSDADGDALAFAVVTGPAHGTLTGTPPALTYTPAANYHGPDGFTFTASDGGATSAPATVSITVTPVNDAPVANAQAVATPEDIPLVVTLTGADVEGSPLGFTVTAGPAHGTLGPVVVTGPNTATVTYTPDPGFAGPDGFLFTVSDGTASLPAAVAVTVTPVNDGPVANAQSVETDEDTAVPVVLTGSDPEGDPLTFAVVAGPLHGTLAGTPPALVYTPDSNFHGPDSISFTVSDGALTSAVAVVAFTVRPVNDGPTASSFAETTPEDTPRAVTLLGSDPEGDPLTFAVVAGPIHGTLGPVVGSQVTYTPAPDFHGLDSFAVVASDGARTSGPATVTILVTPVNDSPSANSQAVATAEDTPVALTLSGSDPDGNPLAFTITTGPAHGALSGIPPALTYTPAANFHGVDAFTFTVGDGTAASAPAVVTIAVAPVNDAPVAVSQSVTTPAGTPVAVLLGGTDADGDALAFTVTAAPAHGTLTGTPPGLVYTPASGFQGTDSFAFVAHDGAATSAPAVVAIAVQGGNRPPRARDDAARTVDHAAVTVPVLANDSDPDGDRLAVAGVGPATWGSAVPRPDGQVRYMPDLLGTLAAAVRNLGLDHKVANGLLSKIAAAAAALARGHEDPAVHQLRALEGELEALVRSRRLALGPGRAVIAAVTALMTGTVVDSFTYVVSDGHGGTATATVRVAVALHRLYHHDDEDHDSGGHHDGGPDHHGGHGDHDGHGGGGDDRGDR